MGNVAEEHAYGASFGCVSRRTYILVFCSLMTVLSYIQLGSWFGKSALWEIVTGMDKTPQHVSGCVGTACYEVFSCFGMREATQHVREPLATVTGAVFFPLGAYGAHHGYRSHLSLFGNYLIASAVVHIAILVADGCFYNFCDMYSLNMITQTLVSTFLPPSPLTPAAQDTLLHKTILKVGEVDDIVGSFNALLWYLSFAGSWALLLCYTASEAHFLGDLMARGPLGLGVHYGLAQWDEVLNHEAIRRHKERGMRSQFIDDAKLPLKCPVDVEAPLGFRASGHGYGALAAAAGSPGAAFSGRSFGFEAGVEGGSWEDEGIGEDVLMPPTEEDKRNYLSEFMPSEDNHQEEQLSPEEAEAEAWRAMADELLDEETHPDRF